MDRSADRLLYVLKATGAQTAATLAKRLGITATAVRQMLAKHTEDELVSFEDRRTSVGRPKRHWRLSDKGHGRFPDSHAGLTLELLNATEAIFGADGLERLISHRETQTLTTYRERLADAGTLAERVKRLAKMRTAEGYMAEARREGDGMLLIENHCPICAAAQRCQSLCRSELQVFQAALGPGVVVERLDHIISGARRCAYRIRPIAAPA
jgi:predicted ArsR family transcriptional regulator